MDIWLRFVLGSLAVWRVSFMLARETGPWDIFARWRSVFGNGALGTVFGCVKCLSVWTAVPFVFFVATEPVERVVSWLALSGVASLIDEVTKAPFEWKETQGDELLRRDSKNHAA